MTRYLDMGYFALSVNTILLMVFKVMGRLSSAVETMPTILTGLATILVCAELMTCIRSPLGYVRTMNWPGSLLAMLVIVSYALETFGHYQESRDALVVCLFFASVSIVESIYRINRRSVIGQARSSTD